MPNYRDLRAKEEELVKMIKVREGEVDNNEEENQKKKMSKSLKVSIRDHFKKIDKHKDAEN